MTRRTVLVLGGGNALGSYQAGVWQRLGEAGIEPERIVGASVGAVNGAIIAGNAPERRIERLQDFWRGAGALWPAGETLRRSAAVMGTMVGGRPGMFGPVGPLGSWWDPDAAAASPALFDSKPLAATLERLVDFERLNASRFAAGAVELESGREMLFDTDTTRIGPDHIRASGALLPTFPPVEVDGVAYVDGGFAQNLPLDAVLAEPGGGPLVCLAVDLTPASSGRPATLGEAMAKAQDLTFAAQSRRTIAKWEALYAADERLRAASVTLVRLVYRDQGEEVAGKAMDFSGATTKARWAAGYRDAEGVLAHLAEARHGTGLRVVTG